jgi:response regulator of citrate/malate metabolism
LGFRPIIVKKGVISQYQIQGYFNMISVLIVEDDLSLQHLYELMLKTFGFKVLAKASNGKEAMDVFLSLENKPDVILMDHRMPVKNGLDTTIEILRCNSHSKIIIISADRSIKKKALSIGAVHFIEKPFSVEKLREEINRIVQAS